MANEAIQSLEDAVNETHKLRENLSAKIIIQETKGHYIEIPGQEAHYEMVYTETDAVLKWGDPGTSVLVPATSSHQEYITDSPAVFGPDKEKIESAKAQLTKIYTSSGWYSARYSAGLAMFEESQFKSNVSLWLYYLKKGLNASSGQSPDDEKRVNAVRDIAKLYSMSHLPILEDQLKDVYANNESENARREAAAQLGYSKTRVWLHERFRGY